MMWPCKVEHPIEVAPMASPVNTRRKNAIISIRKATQLRIAGQKEEEKRGKALKAGDRITGAIEGIEQTRQLKLSTMH